MFSVEQIGKEREPVRAACGAKHMKVQEPSIELMRVWVKALPCGRRARVCVWRVMNWKRHTNQALERCKQRVFLFLERVSMHHPSEAVLLLLAIFFFLFRN